MKKLAVFAVAGLMAACVFGQGANWIGNSFITASKDGGDLAWYRASGGGENPLFEGQNFGLVTSLVLGGQIQSFGDQDGASNPAFMNWQVDAGSWSQVTLNWFQFADNNNWFENTAGGNVAAGVSAGNHNLAIYFSKPTTDTTAPTYFEGNIYDSANSANYNATFQTIPEPATMSLLGLGALAMVLRRKLRK